jgi:phage tail-like protein
MNVVPAIPRHLRQQYRFAVSIDGFKGAYFQKADRPKITFDEVEFNPAGSHRPEKLPGRVSFGDIVLEKGVSAEGVDNAVYLWMRDSVNFLSGVGKEPGGLVRDVEITEYSRTGAVVQTYIYGGAWVKEFDGGELSGDSSDNVIDSITISYQSLL